MIEYVVFIRMGELVGLYATQAPDEEIAVANVAYQMTGRDLERLDEVRIVRVADMRPTTMSRSR